MSRVELSQAFVKGALCPEGVKKVDFFDRQQRGFLLEVRSSGGKTFYQRYTDKRGRERQFKIGCAIVLPLAVARRKARETLAEALIGDDPQERRAELRAIPTLGELVRDRFLPLVKNNKQNKQSDETVLRLHILPALGSLYVDLIRAEPVAALVERMRGEWYSTDRNRSRVTSGASAMQAVAYYVTPATRHLRARL